MGPGETRALRTLAYLTQLGPIGYLKPLLDRPAIRAGGITDAHVPMLLLLDNRHVQNSQVADLLLDPSRVHIDSRTIRTELSGELNLHVIREPRFVSVPVMKSLSRMVPPLEAMMGQAYPTDTVVLLVSDVTHENVGGICRQYQVGKF
jgi:hypothetical protein